MVDTTLRLGVRTIDVIEATDPAGRVSREVFERQGDRAEVRFEGATIGSVNVNGHVVRIGAAAALGMRHFGATGPHRSFTSLDLRRLPEACLRCLLPPVGQ